LDYFVCIYETGSLSAASKAKFIAQPSISASLKQLEQGLSKTLFIRHARGVKATDAAEQLYPLAKQLLGQAQAIQRLFNAEVTKTPFKLGLIKGLGVTRMSRLLRKFTSKVESMELTLVSQDAPCEARIISQDLLHKQEQFTPMWQEEYLLAIPLNHTLGLNSDINVSDLNNLAFIQRTPCTAWANLNQALKEEGAKVDIRARIQTIEYALGLVKAGLGCAFIPVSNDITTDSEIRFRPIKGLPLTREIGLAYVDSSETIDALKHLVRLL
jgi:DNA-binding transcriptional LysR family regulator